MMAEDTQDITDYRDAIESMLLNGEELEVVFPGADDNRSDTLPNAVGITSARVILCYRSLKRGEHDRWRFRSVPYSRIAEVSFARREQFHRNRIETDSSVTIYGGLVTTGGHSSTTFAFRDPAVAREVHDRIIAHMLAV